MQELQAQDMKSCNTDVGGCGRPSSLQQFLEETAPRVFTMQLAWESQQESGQAICETLAAIQEVSTAPDPLSSCYHTVAKACCC
jgi:hypothetical protein